MRLCAVIFLLLFFTHIVKPPAAQTAQANPAQGQTAQANPTQGQPVQANPAKVMTGQNTARPRLMVVTPPIPPASAPAGMKTFKISTPAPENIKAPNSTTPMAAAQPSKSPPPSASPKASGPLPSSKGRTRTKATAKKTATPHADTWAFSTNKPRPVDSIWTQGMAPQALKKAAVSSLKDKALSTGLTAPEVPPVLPPKPQAAKNTLPKTTDKAKSAGMQLRGDVDSISSSWHSSGLKNDLRIDQDMHRLETNIYGAYADIEAGEDLTLSAGPEFSHTRTQSASQSSSHTQTDTGSLGVGFHLKWNF